MQPSTFYTQKDIDALRMENELLSLEVRYLKARLLDPRSSRAVARVPPRQAEADIKFLLKRLSIFPFGWFLRRRRGYRIIEDRYLRS
jgi:hypothetical protein